MTWQRFDIRRIEDLSNAVFGARLEATQMAGPPQGSLAFAAGNGIIFSSGRIASKIALTGTLSDDAVTLAVGLPFAPGSRLFLDRAGSGDVALIRPGGTLDAVLSVGSFYLAATLPEELLHQAAARNGLQIGRRMLAETRLIPGQGVDPALAALHEDLVHLHRGGRARADRAIGNGPALLRALLKHCVEHGAAESRLPRLGHERIVARARNYICANLAEPLPLDQIAAAAGTSRRTLIRAFTDVLEETPAAYVTRLRLHGVRRALIAEAGTIGTISRIAHRCGMREPGRMSARYHTLFGEYPSQTLLAIRQKRRLGAERC
ncbi:helix-turn-helix domain-containing protein [Ensifer sp. NPDC090286]|uniref:helix-turn-helix domain-containing protein n=1 Tax=Ensifer sp. NPDC090286 TaxID=3363991 RepID=UPI00383A8C89